MKKFFGCSVLVLSSFFLFFGVSLAHLNIKGNKMSLKEYKIEAKTVKYLSGKDTVSGYLVMPEGKGPFPALIVVHEWWGLTPWMKSNAEEFAKKGYAALAVDLFRGEVTSDPKVAAELSKNLPKERAVEDLKAAYNYLNSLPQVNKKKIGSIGWCFGGGYSFQTALNEPRLAACVVNYGSMSSDAKELKKIHCPVLCVYGTKDQVFPESYVKGFEKAAKKAGLKTSVHFYEGMGHAFMNPGNKNGYGKKQADAAWKVIYAFLDKNLMK